MKFEDFEALMQESPADENHGHRTHELHVLFEDSDPYSRPDTVLDRIPGRDLSMSRIKVGPDTSSIPAGDEAYHGIVSHRGVLSADETETLDWDLVEDLVVKELGCSLHRLSVVYGPGRPDKERAALMAVIDARLLAIQEAGGNMTVLANVLGWPIRETPTGLECRMMARALKRAKQARNG